MTQSQQQRFNQIIVTMFGAFGQGSDVERMKVYIQYLQPLGPDALEKVAKKVIAESRYLPTIAELLDAAKSLAGTVNPSSRVKSWDEAWGEIERKMYSTSWNEKPQWSTPEIAQAVNNYGWHDLQSCLAENLPTVKAQVRRHYESACERIKEQKMNEFILGESSMADLVGASVGRLAESKMKAIEQ